MQCSTVKILILALLGLESTVGWARRIHGRVTAASYSGQQLDKKTKNDGKRLPIAKIIRNGPFQRLFFMFYSNSITVNT